MARRKYGNPGKMKRGKMKYGGGSRSNAESRAKSEKLSYGAGAASAIMAGGGHLPTALPSDAELGRVGAAIASGGGGGPGVSPSGNGAAQLSPKAIKRIKQGRYYRG